MAARELEISDFPMKSKKKKPVALLKTQNTGSRKVQQVNASTKSLKTPAPKPKQKVRPVTETPVKKQVQHVDRKTTVKNLSKMNNVDLVNEGHELLELMKSDTVFEQNRKQIEQYADMFERSVRIANIFEAKLLNPGEGKDAQSKDVYALLKVYTEIREIIADMKALQDVNEYTSRLDEDVLKPFSRGNAAILLGFIRNIERHAKKFLKPEDSKSIIELLSRIGKHAGVDMQGLYAVAKEQTHKAIVGG
jgi:hypothetical protein